MNPTVHREHDWWKSAVVYQIYPRTFADSDGDGVGDIRGIIDRLDHLVELGVDVVWLSPVYRSPQRDNGYDISDYQDIDPMFGSLEDLDDLIEAAHARGIKLVMDLVVNHTSDEHPWFLESRDPASPRRDWYFWRDPRPGTVGGEEGAEPDDSPAAFAPKAWTFDPRSGQYYLGVFGPQQPDLNWENPEVRRAVYEMMRWWVDRGVDGFRMDVINLISKPEALTGQAPLDGPQVSFEAIGDGPRLDEFLAEMNREVGLSEQNLITVGEMPGAGIDLAVRVTDPARRELNMVFTFEHVDLDIAPGGSKWDLAPLPLPVLKANLAAWQEGLAEKGWNSLYWNNHDQPRAVSRFGDDRPEYRVASAKTLATTLHLHRGTPYIYQGEEFGMTNSPRAGVEDYLDIESLNYYRDAIGRGLDEATVLNSLLVKSRDHARTPVQWDASENAGFTTGTPWAPVNPGYETVNAVAAREDPDSIFHHYRRLIQLRHESAVVRDGEFRLLHPEHPHLWAFTRGHGDEQLLVLANWSAEELEIPEEGLPEHGDAELLLGTHGTTAGTLAPWESRVLRLAGSPA